MYKKYLLPLMPPPLITRAEVYDLKVKHFENMICKFNTLTPLDMRLDLERLGDTMLFACDLNEDEWSVMSDVYPYLKTIIFAKPHYLLIKIKIDNIFNDTVSIIAEYHQICSSRRR